MRRIVVTEFVSLDGVMEDPGGAEGFVHGGWTFAFPDPAGMRFKLEEVLAHDALLLGRATYEGFAAAWPSITDEVGFAAQMNGMRKYVISNTLSALAWNNSTLLHSTADIAALKAQSGGDILVCGSATLVQSLIAERLIDEYRLMIFPVLLGGGKRLFGAHHDLAPLTLASCERLESGTLIAIYQPAA